MHVKKRILPVLASALSLLALAGCGNSAEGGLQNGYYTAQTEEYDFGWREYVTIMVKDAEIVSVEYNAENASGFIKSWDNAYMRNMLPVSGTYPNEYTRYYASQLVGATKETEIDAISGATSSHEKFVKLMQAVIQQARAGDSSIVTIKTA